MWLTLVVLLHINTLVDGQAGKTVSADEVKAEVCPNCRTIQDGDIQEFWVIYFDKKDIRFSRSHVNKAFEPGSIDFFFQNSSLYLIPAYHNNDKYYNYFVEATPTLRLNLYQLELPEQTIPVCRRRGEKMLDNQNIGFVHKYYYIVNETTAYDVTDLCQYLPHIPTNKWDIAGCFKENSKCVTDFETGKIVKVDQKNAIYKWGRLVVWIGCTAARCIYLIHDIVDGTGYYIPDDIPISTDYTIPPNHIHALVPLITSNTSLLKQLEISTTSTIEDQTTFTTAPTETEGMNYVTVLMPVESHTEPEHTNIYFIFAPTIAAFVTLIAIIILLCLTYRKRRKRNKTTKSLGKQPTRSTSKSQSKKGKKSKIRFKKGKSSATTKTSKGITTNIDAPTVKCLVCTAEQDKMFAANEVQGLEAELPFKQLEGPAMPDEGTYVVFKHIGVTLPPKVFAHTFGEFDLNLGQDQRTIVYEYESCGLKRVEAISAIMTHTKDYQKNHTIQEMVCTVRLDKLNIRILVIPKLGPSVESTVRGGKLSLEEKISLVSQTLSCMEDLLECNVVHRDIKPSSFRYDIDGPKIFVTNLGLARIPTAISRPSVPFFGNVIFASLSTHLQLERTHYDDMISWFYVVLFIIHKEMLVWKLETDKTRMYQLKNNFLDEKVIKQHTKTFIKDRKARDLVRGVHELVVQLPAKKKPSYSKIRKLVDSFSKKEIKTLKK